MSGKLHSYREQVYTHRRKNQKKIDEDVETDTSDNDNNSNTNERTEDEMSGDCNEGSEESVKFERDNPNNPFSATAIIPLPGEPFEAIQVQDMEPSLIRRRNERERERVRCVNEGYNRLRRHLPLPSKERRISKVETLRCAIRYIEFLQDLIHYADQNGTHHPCVDNSQYTGQYPV